MDALFAPSITPHKKLVDAPIFTKFIVAGAPAMLIGVLPVILWLSFKLFVECP